MTKNELMQYKCLKREVERLRQKVNEARRAARAAGNAANTAAVDNSSGGSAPCVAGSQRLTPPNPTAANTAAVDYVSLLELKEKECSDKLTAIREFINEIDDSLIRQIIDCRFVDAMSWAATAMALGGGNTPDGVRMAATRYFKTR